ncbi:MAG: glycosyltransferase family 4 protein, partial [Promethearchaeota archaeon]
MRFLIPKLIGDYFIKIFFIPPLGLRVVADYESEYQMGAIEQQIFGLSKELALMGHQVYIIRRWKSLNEFDKIEGVNLININVPTSQRSFHENLSLMRLPVVLLEHFLFLKEVRQKITEIHPDIVNLSTLLMAYLFLKLERKDCWKIFINHSHDVFLNNGFFSLAKRRMIKSVIKNAHKTITLNKGMKQCLLNQG